MGDGNLNLLICQLKQISAAFKQALDTRVLMAEEIFHLVSYRHSLVVYATP